MATVTRHSNPPAGESAVVTATEFLAGPIRPGVLLIDGAVFMNDATHLHQRICSNLYAALLRWLDADGHGRVGWGGNWVLNELTVVKPDVWWMSTEEGPGRGPRYDGPPDLAVEVLSPGTRHLDLGRKGQRYLEAGLPELWLVDPRNHMVVARRFDADDDEEFAEGATLTSPQLPGFALSIDELFA